MVELTLEDVLDIEYPGPPAWSDDGAYLAATVYEDNGRALQFAEATGAPCWRYRPSGSHVSEFTWRPDSHECLIITEGGRTVLVDPAEESERTLTTADESEPVWSNDGKQIACYRDGTPWILNIETGENSKIEAPERGPYLSEEQMFAWSVDDSFLAYRFVDYDTKQIGVIDVDTGELIYRTDTTSSSHTPAWLADDSLLFDRMSEHATCRELVMVHPQEGRESVVFREEELEVEIVSQGAPAVSPDGTRFAITLPLDGWDHLYVVDEGKPEQVTHGEFEDKGVADSGPVWLDDKTLVFSSNRREPEQRGIYTLNLETDTVEAIVETPGTNVYPAPSPNGERVAYIHADTERSPELRVRERNTDSSSPGTRVTESVVAEWPVDPITPDRVTIETDDGFDIPAFLIDPRKGSSIDDDATELPALVWVHGGPMRQMREGWHPSRSYGLAYAVQQYFAQQGYVGLLVNYRGGIGYGQEFRQAISNNPGAEIDIDIVASADYLKDLAYVDSNGIALWGLSYGGYAALRVLGTAPDAYDLGINLAGIADYCSFADWATESKYPRAESQWPAVFGGNRWEAPDVWEEASPVTHMKNYSSPIYNFHGTADRYVNFEQLDITVDELLQHDVDFHYEYYPDENHLFSKRCVWEHTLERIETALSDELPTNPDI